MIGYAVAVGAAAARAGIPQAIEDAFRTDPVAGTADGTSEAATETALQDATS
jgi:hypothetical protein